MVGASPAWVSCGPGWYRIVIDLDRHIASFAPDARYAQIKEKFGGLRVYVNHGSAEVDALIRDAKRRPRGYVKPVIWQAHCMHVSL
jgi:hypothetical protein